VEGGNHFLGANIRLWVHLEIHGILIGMVFDRTFKQGVYCGTMTPKKAEAEFRKRLACPVENLTASKGIAAMLAFYVAQRAKNVVVEDDGDMLLFQWGITPVEPEEFHVNITRQFFRTGEDEPYHLSLSFSFPPAASPANLKSGNRWCRTPEDVEEFGSFIESSPAFAAVKSGLPMRVELAFFQC
jgi:hypothetical protein